MATLKNVGLTKNNFSACLQLFQKRSAFIGQTIVDPPVAPRNYDVSRDEKEWKYVTSLLNRRTVPTVSEKPEYPSGWVPPSEKAKSLPYFVERNKNHMIPLYLLNEDRGKRKITVIRRIQGDIWKLHDDVKEYVEEKHGKRIPSQILESNSVVKLKGDHYHWVEQWMLSKGF